MKKIIGVLGMAVLSVVIMNSAFASEPQGMTQEDATSKQAVWPFEKSGEAYPGDAAQDQGTSAIDNVKVDLALDPADKTFNPPKPEGD